MFKVIDLVLKVRWYSLADAWNKWVYISRMISGQGQRWKLGEHHILEHREIRTKTGHCRGNIMHVEGESLKRLSNKPKLKRTSRNRAIHSCNKFKGIRMKNQFWLQGGWKSTWVCCNYLKNASEAMENMNRSSKFLHSCFNEVKHRERLGGGSSTWYNSLFG